MTAKQLNVLRGCLTALMALCLFAGVVLWFALPLHRAQAAEVPEAIYRLDFSDAATRGKNSASSGIADAEIVDGGKITYDETAPHGGTALNMTSDGHLKNYVKIPADVLNRDTLTFAGWFKLSQRERNYARLFEFSDGTGTNNFFLMPQAGDNWGGFNLQSHVKGQVFTQTLDPDSYKGDWAPAGSLLYEGQDPDCEGNAPKANYILPITSTWVHYAFELTPEYVALYENGVLLKQVEGNFSAKQYYGPGGGALLGATVGWSDNDFTGSFSDIRFYDKALTAEELVAAYELTYNDFLTTSYDFEDTDPWKESVRGYNATPAGAAKVEQDEERGSKVLVLDGTTTEPTNNATRTSMNVDKQMLNGHNSLTISFDAYVDSDTPAYTRLFEFGATGGIYLSLTAKFGGTPLRLRFTMSGDPGSQDVDTDLIKYDTWANYTITIGGGKATLYIDGVPVVSKDNFVYNNAVWWDAFMSGSAFFNFGRTQYYGDNPMIGKLDNIKVWAAALTEKELLTELGIITIQDDQAAVESEKDKLTVTYTEGAGHVDLPTLVGEGVHVSWQSDHGEIVTSAGDVLMPEAETQVKLTATLTRGTASVTKEFTITVKPMAFDASVFDGAALGAVSFPKGSYYYGLMKTNLDYMMSLDKDRLLYNFRKIAGLDTLGFESYGGWISPKTGGAGQFESHYMVALAKASQTMPDYTYEGETVLQRLQYMFNVWKQCAEAYGEAHPGEKGYFGAISTEHFDIIETTRATQTSDGVNIWVPWYHAHKTLEALLDIQAYAADETIRTDALKLATDYADWVYNRVSKLDAAHRSQVLAYEYGGMGEVLYQVFGITHKANHLAAARFFEEEGLLENLYNKVDVLGGRHANTTIPKFLAAAAAYEATGNERYKTIAANAFDLVMERTYANGSTSIGEHWQTDDAMRVGNDTAETCCSYNMLKLADYLYRWTGEKKYMDYFENVYTNHILASMDPETGMKTYLTNTAFGHHKIYHTREGAFWCCACTGLESFAKLVYGIYYSSESKVTVNMFYPSEYRYTDGITISQSGDFFTEQKTSIKITGGGNFTLALRKPDWATEATVKVNGEPVETEAESGYFELTRNWQDGDTVEYALPFTLRLDLLKGNENTYALMYGPLLLVADLGKEGVNDIKDSQVDFSTAYTGDITNKIVFDGELADCYTVGSDEEGLTVSVKTLNQGTLLFRPFNQVFHSRYGMYFDVYDSVDDIVEITYDVTGNEDGYLFDDMAELSGSDVYNSADKAFTVEDGKLVSSSDGEGKVLLRHNLTAPYGVEVTISAYTPNAMVNAGVYVLASSAGKAADGIKAYNVHLHREANSSTCKVDVFRFDNRYIGSVGSTNVAWNGSVTLRVLVTETDIHVFIGGRTPVLSVPIDKKFITEEKTTVGLRAQIARVCFDDFRVVSESLPVGTYRLDAALRAADKVKRSAYSAETLEELDGAVAAARTLLAGTYDQEAVNEAAETVRTALSALAAAPVDPTDLLEAVKAAKALNAKNYTATSFAKLTAVLAKIDAATLNSASVIAQLRAELAEALVGLRLTDQPAEEQPGTDPTDPGTTPEDPEQPAEGGGCGSVIAAEGGAIAAVVIGLVAAMIAADVLFVRLRKKKK